MFLSSLSPFGATQAKVKTTQPNLLQYTTVSGKTKTTLSKLSDLDFLKKKPGRSDRPEIYVASWIKEIQSIC